ncbi:MAG: MGMT family protein [bacterium]
MNARDDINARDGIETASVYQKIYAVVRRIPRGAVASYGRIARMVGASARQVGYAMAATPSGQGIPWHRVINSQGKISARKDGDGDARQRELLLDEGVVFDRDGRIDFERFGWVEDDPRQATLLPPRDD